MTWIESRLFEFFSCIAWFIFSCFFSDSLGRKVWPFSGPTGSVTADQISTGRVRFLASVSGTTFLVFFGPCHGAALMILAGPEYRLCVLNGAADRRRIVIVCVRKNL